MILALETSTKNCSVALIANGALLQLMEQDSDQYIHSEKLHLFIKEVLDKAAIKAQDLKAIAIGAGPGSYTGLRIGVATAKSLAYALKVPLISAKGSDLLLAALQEMLSLPANALVHPMIDARRMEVYTGTYNVQSAEWTDLKAQILEEGQYSDPRPHYFIGDGAAKAKELFTAENHHFPNLVYPSARDFTKLAMQRFENQIFEDPAYFEPFYLKDFIALRPKSVF